VPRRAILFLLLVGAAAWYLWPEKPEHKIISRQPGKPITRATFHEVSA